MTATAAAARAASTRTREVLERADGVELLGEFEDSGFRRPPLLARRPDGQMVQLTRLLYLVAEACDGHRDAEAVAAVVSERFGRGLSAANVRQLAEEQLRPQGVLALADGTSPELPKRVALLALRHRRPILSERVVNVAAAGLAWLHVRPLKAALLVALVLFDAWLFGVHGIAGGVRSVLYEPAWLLAVLVSIVLATIFHEFGHASACRYGGARPGVMGVGVYLIWPAFYCDVTEAYRLNRRGRLRTDLGGVYFNGLFALAAGGAYFATGHEALLFAAFVQHIIVLQQLLPLMRFDGYYVLSDLTGVPDILSRIKPIFRSLVRGARREPRVAELKPWVRFVVTAYLLVLVPLLAFVIGWIIISAPRMFATAYDSFGLQLDRMADASGAAEAGVGVFRICALAMPLAAMALSLTRTGKMAGLGLARWASGSAFRTAAATAVTVTAVATAAFVWWPNGDYEPIRPGERGTIGEAIRSVPAIPSGRPSFTPERARHFGAAPTVREAATAGTRRGTGRDVRNGGDDGTPVAPDRREPMPTGEGGFERDGGTDTLGADPYEDFDPGDTSTGTVQDPGATATPTPSGTAPADGTATPTPTPTPTPTSTAAPSPTTTPAPTTTGTVTPSPEGTALASPTASPIPDVQAPTAQPTPVPTP